MVSLSIQACIHKQLTSVVVEQHPTLPIVAVSGIDSTVKVCP